MPSKISSQILKPALEDSLIMSRAQVFPMSSRKESLPIFSGWDHSNESLYGGFSID